MYDSLRPYVCSVPAGGSSNSVVLPSTTPSGFSSSPFSAAAATAASAPSSVSIEYLKLTTVADSSGMPLADSMVTCSMFGVGPACSFSPAGCPSPSAGISAASSAIVVSVADSHPP